MSIILSKPAGDFPVIFVKTADRHIPVEVIPKKTPLREVIRLKESAQIQKDDDSPFYVVDVGRIIDSYDQWMSVLPNVTPFYAVKVNNDPVLLKVLAELGIGFDCASKNEMRDVLALGVSPERIIFANPCKMISHLKYAASCGVKKMTFDNEEELLKVKKYFPDAKLVLRFKHDNPSDVIHMDVNYMGQKFGCSVDEGKQLLNVAKSLQLDIIGVSFHVGIGHDGRGHEDPGVYLTAIRMSTELFDYAFTIGYKLSLLDIGGGYPGHIGSEKLFCHIADGISQSLAKFSARFPKAEFVSEPGRYFACSTHTLALAVHSKKVNTDGSRAYFVTDGIHSSFQFLKSFKLHIHPDVLKEVDPSCTKHLSDIWGPTLAPDKICSSLLPELDVGDWIYFKDWGGYTTCLTTKFCGFPSPSAYYYIDDSHRSKQILQGRSDSVVAS